MHGLFNRAVRNFLCDTFGAAVWADVAARSGIGDSGLEAMRVHDDALTEALLAAAGDRLARPRDGLLEDLGTYLVSHPRQARLRRLLRFGGVDFLDFLHSLDDLPDRARLAVRDLIELQLELTEQAEGRFALACRSGFPGLGHVAVGVLRAMADDYGALVLIDHAGEHDGVERITIQLLDSRHAAARPFALVAEEG
jgi:hypothetical protein